MCPTWKKFMKNCRLVLAASVCMYVCMYVCIYLFIWGYQFLLMYVCSNSVNVDCLLPASCWWTGSSKAMHYIPHNASQWLRTHLIGRPTTTPERHHHVCMLHIPHIYIDDPLTTSSNSTEFLNVEAWSNSAKKLAVSPLTKTGVVFHASTT